MEFADSADWLGGIPVMADVSIEAGKLNQRITIQVDAGTTFNAAGQPIPDWQNWTAVDGGLVWAGFRALSGREYERANQMQVYATHMITMRWVPGLTAVKMRAVMNGREFDFGWVNNVEEANVKAEIWCGERIA